MTFLITGEGTQSSLRGATLNVIKTSTSLTVTERHNFVFKVTAIIIKILIVLPHPLVKYMNIPASFECSYNRVYMYELFSNDMTTTT